MLVAARIERGPNNVGAQVGANVELKCSFHHRSCNDMMWSKIEEDGSPTLLYMNNRVLANQDRYSVNVSRRGGCTLRINRLQVSDAGIFACTEIPEVGPQITKSATITIAGRPMLEFICLCISHRPSCFSHLSEL